MINIWHTIKNKINGPATIPANHEITKTNNTDRSSAKVPGVIGIIAITVGNIAAIVTHIDHISEFISKAVGADWVYRLHSYILIGACAFFLLGYGSLTYWLYRNFVVSRSLIVKGLFGIAALVAVGSTVVGSYQFLFKPVDVVPLIREQLSGYQATVLSQQALGGQEDGGFRFSQTGISNDTQVWTTAQCLVALLQQNPAMVREAAPAIRRAFSYVERARLKLPGSGWGYLRTFSWGVTDIDAWVALAYIYSLRGDNASLVWKPDELPDVIAEANRALDLLLERQHEDGGWAPIEKTSNPRHERTYSTLMAVWALTSAEQIGDLLKVHGEIHNAAVTSGAKWLLESYAINASGFSGWWPNPSEKNRTGEYPGLTAQVLFVLSEVKRSHSFVAANPRYREAVVAFIALGFQGSATLGPLTRRKVFDNEKAHDSDRYLEERTETCEQSTFLWYPWVVAMSDSLAQDPLLDSYQQDSLRQLSSALLERNSEENKFVRADAAIYPIAEILFADGYHFSRPGSGMRK